MPRPERRGESSGDRRLPAAPSDPSAFEVLPEGVVLLDADGLVRWVSGRARDLLALGADAIGSHVDDAMHLLSEGGDRCRLAPSLGGHGDRIAERLLEVALEGRRHRTVAVSGARLADGTVLTFRHAGRRRLLDRARSDLVATVSHEIRSPLTSVKGFTRTLLLKWDRFSDEQKRAMLETVDADADRVTRLLTELLDVSRIDAGRVSLRRSLVDLPALAQGIVERARVSPAAEGREVLAQVDGEVPRALLDADKVEQVLSNLVENALNYAEGRVVVRVSAVAGAVVAEVADEGPGIAPDQAATIFEKFGRGRDVRRAGTGLGLYISRGLVRAHGGDLELVGEPGRGATFRATLPLVRDAGG